MKKFYFLIASLFIAMGAMAQSTTVVVGLNSGKTDTDNKNDGTYWLSNGEDGLRIDAVLLDAETAAVVGSAKAFDVYNGQYTLIVCQKINRVDYPSTTFNITLPESSEYVITGFKLNGEAFKDDITIVCGENSETVANGKTGGMEMTGLKVSKLSFAISVSSYNQSASFDVKEFVVYLEKEAAEPAFAHTLTVGDAGWATLYLGFDAKIPANVEAYTVSTVEDGYAKMVPATGVLAAMTGVLVKAAAGNYSFAYTTEAATVTESALEGTLFDTAISGYVLADGDNGIGFYATEDNFVSKANKAYLPATAMSSAAFYGFLFEGTTGVENVEVENGAQVIFDLTGRRIESINAAGIYIVNGKKVLVK